MTHGCDYSQATARLGIGLVLQNEKGTEGFHAFFMTKSPLTEAVCRKSYRDEHKTRHTAQRNAHRNDALSRINFVMNSNVHVCLQSHKKEREE